MPTQSSYPTEIADAICKRWSSLNCDASLLPDAQHVVQLVDIMYQASLLREESEIILCRTMVCQPSDFAEELQHGASGVQVLRFAEPCLLSPNQVRKLAPAAGYFRSMLAVHFDQADRAVIWGIISTGTDWINRADVASERDGDLPDNLVIHCLGPGHLIASCGDARVLESANGKLLTEGFDPFRSKWLPQRFGSVRNAMLKWIESHTAGSLANQTKMCDDFVRDLAQSVVRRTLRLVRTRGHGGMLIYLPDSIISSDKLETWMRFRVHFEPDPSTNRFQQVMLQIIARAHALGYTQQLRTVRYRDYRSMSDRMLERYEATLIELSHFFADLMHVDGALVLDHSFRLIGFGAEILGDSHVHTIHRALDLEATNTRAERADTSGTRHRSAYRLVSGISDSIAVVVSQDGDVRFVANHNDKLTYWPYLP